MTSANLSRGSSCDRKSGGRARPFFKSFLGKKALLICCGLVLGLVLSSAYRDFKKHSQKFGFGSAKNSAVFSNSDLIKISFWEKYHIKSDIVMIGDSHTDMVDWRAVFPNKNIVNRGISGDTTRAVLARLDAISLVSAKTSVVMLGSNDIVQGIAIGDIEKNYEAIIEKLRGFGSQVIVMSTPLMASRSHSERISMLNTYLSDYCGVERCTFVDLNQRISKNGSLRSDRTIDGLHLNGAGYADWASMLGPYL